MKHQEILKLIRSNYSPKAITSLLERFHPLDLAETFPLLEKKEREALYRILSPETLSEILEYTDSGLIYLEEMDTSRMVRLLEIMESDSAAEFLKQLSSSQRKLILDLMNGECRRELLLLLSYEEDQIASRMTTNFISIPSHLTIQEAMKEVRSQATEHDNISVIYVTDESSVFYGALSLKDLIISPEDTLIEDILTTEYPYVYADADVDDCLERLRSYSEDSIPVLSDTNQILGIITSQDLLEVVDEEMGEDYARLAGLTEEETIDEPLKASIAKRLPWLVLLLGLGLVVSSVVGIFESVVSQLTLIICFQSLILDMAGNVGTQSLAVTIRALTEDAMATVSEKACLVFREVRIGLTNGCILGLLSFIGVGLYLIIMKHQTSAAAFGISGCIGLALVLAMVISSLVGTVIPLFFHYLGADPAVASGPLITTVNDLVAVISYYGLAWLFLIRGISPGI